MIRMITVTYKIILLVPAIQWFLFCWAICIWKRVPFRLVKLRKYESARIDRASLSSPRSPLQDSSHLFARPLKIYMHCYITALVTNKVILNPCAHNNWVSNTLNLLCTQLSYTEALSSTTQETGKYIKFMVSKYDFEGKKKNANLSWVKRGSKTNWLEIKHERRHVFSQVKSY